MKLIEAIGIRLDNLIDENNTTIYSLAKDTGVPRSTVWKIIHPDLTRVKTVKIDTIYQLTDTLGITLSQFFDNPIYNVEYASKQFFIRKVLLRFYFNTIKLKKQ